jgi:hypothetical protein
VRAARSAVARTGVGAHVGVADGGAGATGAPPAASAGSASIVAGRRRLFVELDEGDDLRRRVTRQLARTTMKLKIVPAAHRLNRIAPPQRRHRSRRVIPVPAVHAPGDLGASGVALPRGRSRHRVGAPAA